MPIITKAGTPAKGSSTQFTLDKSALAAVTSVAADAYYSDSTNWKEVQLNYKSSTGNQSEIVKFDATLASPTANFAVSLKARNAFEIHKIVIKDFDGGVFEVPRSALTAADFDVDMSVIPPVSGYRYIKFAAKNGWMSNNDGNVVNIIDMSDFALRWGGVDRNLSSYTKTIITQPSIVSPNIEALTDGIINDSNNHIRWEPNGTIQDLFSIDLGANQSISDVLIAPYYFNAFLTLFPPKEFKVYGSVDGVTYSEILSVNAIDNQGWTVGAYRAFPII